VNEGCNLRCSFCDLWEHHEHLSLERLLPILDDAVDIGTKTIVLTGGEPLIHPEIFAVIHACKERGLAVNMTTNGTLVEKYWDVLIDTEIDSLSFSLDGLKQTHERIRGQEGCFDRTFSALKRITEETSIQTSVYFVVTSENLAELWDVYILAKSLGSKFDFWPVNDAPDLYLRKEQHDLWRQIVARIIADDPSFASKKAFYADSLQYHSEDWHGKVRCLGFVDQYGITYKGEFLPCCVWQGEGLVQGNVFEKSLKDLWLSPETQAYRQGLTENGCGVGCFNHSLYEFEQSTGLSFELS
jgi:MoaA/NifB/PqqE/SkfB family radical SAM enzyme